METRPVRVIAAAIAIVSTLSACSGPIVTRPSPVAPAGPTTSPARTEIPATPSPAPPTPTPIPPLAIADLPRIEFQTVRATAVCDPEPSQFDIDAGDTTLFCSDGLALALATVGTVTHDPVVRAWFDRPTCTSTPCTEDELSTARVTAWTATEAFEVELDSRLETIPQPTVVFDAVWPPSGAAAVPVISRPSIKGAPRVVAGRAPYPFCGRAELGEPAVVLGCFRDAVLSGRKAEVIDQAFGTEGGAILWIYRFDGFGPLVRFQHDQSAGGDGRSNDIWMRNEGAMSLGIDSLNWDFIPWWGTELKLAT